MTLAATVLLAIASAAATWPEERPQEASRVIPAELSRVLTDYQDCWGKKDAAALAALFAEDGFVLPGGRPPVKGRAAIQSYYAGHGGPLFLRPIAWAHEGSVGYIIGEYAGSQSADADGKFTLTLTKGAGGRWLIMSDMDNSNRPPR